MKFNLLRIALVSFLAFLAVVFSACDVGLGEAVDTEKPTISIEYPPKNVVIKEDFVISGKCHDETSMKSVTLAFQNSESEHVEKFTATLAQDKNSWSARINEYDSEKGKYLLPDGTYFVTAVATDSSGRQQEDKMTLRIDNTPPMIVLTNPGTVENEENPLEKAGGFGATIKIQGSVSDFSVTDNDSGSKLVFTVFDKNDKFLAYRELSNIPPSLGIIIGEYTDGTENLTDSNQFYKKIYGAAGSVVDTKYRKFKITVSDSARTYKGSAVNNERGNISECYYLKDEIYTDVNNKFSIGNSDLYEIIKKQAGKTGDLTDHEKTILSSLEKFRHDSDDEYEGSEADDSSRAAETSGTKALKIKPVGTFFLNPKNNPSYEITSFDAFDFTSEKKWEERKISTSGNITLLAKSGLSEAPLEADSFKVVLFKTDENGIRIQDTETEKNEDKEIPCEWTKNGSNYTGRITLSSKYVEVAQCYGIELKGYDKAGLEFYNGSKAYRFSVQTGSTPPDVKINGYSSTNSGSTVYIKKNDSGAAVDLVISGTAESRSGSKKGHVTLWPVVNGDKTQYANRDNKFITKSNSEKDWSITVPGAYFNNKDSDTYTVALYASDEISNETYKEITVIFDKENPKVQINSVDNVVVFDSETTIAVGGGGGTLKAEPNVGYVNDVITVSGNVSDNDAFDKGSWKAMCGETEIAGGVLSSSQIKITIDTKTDKNGNAVDFEGNNLELKFTVFDRAGNKADYEYKYPDENGKPLVISQLTDYPRVNLSNAELTVTTEDGIAVGKNLFDQTGNNKITGSVVDDDGIKTIDIQYAKYTESGFTSLLNNPIDCKGKTSWSFNQELKDSGKNVLAEGNYKIKIIATDINGKQTELEPFAVCISNSAPSITFTNPLKNTASYQAENFTVKGTVSGQFKLDGASSGSVLKRGENTVTVNADGTWEDKISYNVDLSGNGTPKNGSGITKGEGVNYKIEYVVTDRFSRETRDFVEFLTDYTQPVVNIADSSVEAYIGKTKTTLHSFSGTVAEENALKSLEYSIVKSGVTLVEWTSIPAQKTFNANIDFKDIAENDVEVCFRATDAANNISVITNDSKRKVKIIENAPTIDSIKISGDSKQIDSIYYVKGNYKISGKATSSALNKVTVANKEWTSADFETDELSASGSYTFTAEDKAGQTASVSVSVVLDKDAPKPDFSQVSPVVLGYAGTPAVYKNGAVNGGITVQGTSSDNDKIVSTVLKIFKANAAGAPDGAAIHELSYDGTGNTENAISVAQDSTANNFKFTVDTAKLTDKEGIILRLVSVDRAGNEGFLDYPVFVCQETDIPTLKFNNGDVACTDENLIKVGKNLFGMGSDILFINVADDDGVASVTYTVDGAEKPALLTGGKSTTADVQINVSELGNGVHSLVFTVTDVNGKSVKFPSGENSSIKIAYDSDVPEISVLKLGDVTYTSGCFAKETFKISGEIKDSSGTVEIYEKANGVETKVSEISDCSVKKTWVTKEITNNSGDITKMFVARDKYGREKTLEINYKVDNVPPVFVSDYISITGETVGGSKTYVLGGTGDVYNQDNVWFTGSSFTLKGGDGTNSKIPVTETNNFEIKLYKGSYSEENLISTIQPSGNNNFSGTVDVGGENASTIILVAVDEAKNKSTPLSVQVNVDRGAPLITNKEIYLENPNTVVSAQALPEKGYVNKDSVFVKFGATDSVSKVKSVEIYKTAALKEQIGQKEFSPAVEDASGVIEINISRFDSKEYDLYIKVTDVAGNSSYTDLPNFIFDKNPPVVTYSRPAANSDVNKLITIEGLIDDLNPPATNAGWNWALKVKKPGGTSFEPVNAIFDTSLEETGKFKVSGIDTEKIGEGTAEFIVIATDRAGNVIQDSGANTGKTLALKIDQNSDRPVIQLNTISTDGATTLSSSTVSGIASDDDGVKKVEVRLVKKNGALADSGWKTAVLNGSNWTCTYFDSSNDIDGDYELYLRVTDSEGTVFTTEKNTPAGNAVWSCPRINFEGTNEVCSAVPFSIDSNPPTIKYFKFRTSKDKTTWSEWAEVGNNQLFGGVNYRYVQFRVLAYDTVSEQPDLSIAIKIPEIGRTYLYNKTKASTDIKLSDATEKIDEKIYRYFETTEAIDFNNAGNPADFIPTGSYTIEAEARDKAEKPKAMSLGILVDNTAPAEIKNLNHSESEELTGEILLTGQVADDSKANSGVAEIYYAVPYTSITSPENLADSSDTAKSIGEKWTLIAGESSIVWSIAIKPDEICTTNASTIVMKDGYLGFKEEGDSKIYKLPVWFKIVDRAGNVGYVTGNHLRYNPDADKPRAAISYPAHNVSDGSFGYVVMGGTIRFSGSAEDDEGIQAVYLQFDMDGDGKFENGAGVDGCPADVVVQEIPYSEDASGNKQKGVLARGTSSWNYSLKVSGLKNLLYTKDNKKTLNVRVVALDTGTNDKPLLGEWSEIIHISVNNDVPAFESVKLVQYSDASASAVAVKTVDYQADKYISGENWYLRGTVSSNAGISKIVFEDTSTSEITIKTDSVNPPVVTDANNLIVKKIEEGGNIKEITYEFPVKIENTDYWKVKITVTDNASEGNEKSNAMDYSLNIDNTAPEFFDLRNSSEYDKYGTIRLYKNEYGSNALDDTNFVQNSNRTFTLAGRITEAGSGYENVIFYFKRVPKTIDAANPERVYNPMEAHGSGNKENRTDITEKSAVDGKVYINKDNLPVLYDSKLVREGEATLSSDYVKDNKNVRAGGLVKIGGVYRKIRSVDYASGKVTLYSESEVTNKEAEFVYGMVIDNSGESLNYDNSIKNDDGDGMVESFSKSGSNYTWDASIDSTNIPDGPIEIHVVAFDKAGNSKHGYAKTSVSNNAPRIARVRLATDLNSNGSYEENESKVFAWLDEDTTKWDETTKSSGTEIWNLDGSGWIIKKNLQVEPEFVGGTPPFHYIFTMNSGDSDANNLNSAKTGAATGVISKNKEAFVIPNDNFDKSATYEDKVNTYSFSFWDSTEETTPCQDSQWTVLNVKLKQDIADTVVPKVVVDPFFWNSKEDNSLYKNSLQNGHIELEDDWKNASGYVSSDTTGEYDSDPKVSGKIVIRGTAYDDVCLSSLWIKFGNTKQKFTFADNTIAGADFGTGLSTDEYVSAAYYDSAKNKWSVAPAKMETAGWEFAVEEEYFDQNGHKVRWMLSLDTARLENIAGTDIEFRIMAVDHLKNNGHKSSESNSINTLDDASIDKSDAVYNKPAYRMDVVPYITGVKTYLSKKLKTSIVEAYTRTTLGHYIISDRESSIELEGFNLGNNNTVDATASGFSSGEYVVLVNEVETLNNKNNNNACGSYKEAITEDSKYEQKANYAYNRQPVEKSNHLLTDDIYFDVWEFDSDAAIPMSGKLSEPVMKINPSNGKIGFAFVSGPADFSMADGLNHSYKNYQRNYATFSNISMAFDDKGYSYGTATGLDTYPSGPIDTLAGRFTFMTSRWGTDADSMDDNYNYENKLRLEAIGLPGNKKCYVKGTYPSTYTMTETRFSSPSLAVASHGDTTSVYLAYYDDIQSQIRFRYGSNCPGSKDDFDNFVDNEGLGEVISNKNNNDNGNDKKRVFEADTSKFSLIAGVDWQKFSSSKKISSGITYNVGGNYFYDTGYAAGQYVAIDVIPGSSSSTDIVVAVWYDGSDCWYGYNTNPTSGKDNGIEGGWKCKKIFSDGGEFCTVKAGPDGSVHIAANVDGSLCYAYLSSYAASYNEATDSVIVDSFTITGEQINIDVGRRKVVGVDGSTKYYVIPYISYYVSAAKMPAVASLVIPVSGVMDYTMQGTVNDVFTGGWEVSLVPTDSTMSGGANDKVNIGLWKQTLNNMKGVIVKSTELNKITSSSNNSTASYGDCYGNGTDNAVLGYAVKTSSGTAIETAQLK